MSQSPAQYVGTELELFAEAHNWKDYWVSFLRPHMQGDVLEVGAGIGANTLLFENGQHRSWICLEPDDMLASQIPASPRRKIVVGTLEELDPAAKFDAIIYIDVMEHIEKDQMEARRAAEHLKPGGVLGLLWPAHMWVYSPFDRAIGHHRRYTTKTLSAIIPTSLRQLHLGYLDSVGLLASSGNRALLKQSMPTANQIRVWDRWMVPLSKHLDPVLRYTVGKSVLGLWANSKA
jgi:hypothetical protein